MRSIKKYFLFLSLMSLSSITFGFAIKPEKFIQTVQAEGRKYNQISQSPETDRLFLEGHKSTVTEQLKSLVPDHEKSAADYFILSNTLFRTDPQASYTYIKKANELAPNDPNILFEWAMREHRAGNCQAALPLYEKAATLLEQIPYTYWGYVTHCQLILGQYTNAIKSWKKADFSKRHTSIETSMYEIFSFKDPDTEREKLIADISRGSSNAVCELVNLDKNWEINWWNVKENDTYLVHDIELIKSAANRDKTLSKAAKLCVDAIELSDEAFREDVTQAGYWGKEYMLPDTAAETYLLIRELTKRNIATPAEILKVYEAPLLSRLKAQPTDKRTLDLLAYLYSSTKNQEQLKVIDEHGWKVLKLQNYAESYAYGLPQDSAEYRAFIQAAAQEFPNSARLQEANWALHKQSKDEMIYLAKYVAAQFANVKNNWQGPDRLNNYMNLLQSKNNRPR